MLMSKEQWVKNLSYVRLMNIIPKISKKRIERLRSLVKKTRKCWNWTGCTTKGGYGQFKINGKKYYVHRIVYYLYYGQPRGIIMHTCDNPSCCNPKHLKDGTQAENLADMVRKGRQNRVDKAKGENNGNSKLTEKKVKQIRKMPGTQKEIAKLSGVSQNQISRIKNKRNWTHI